MGVKGKQGTLQGRGLTIGIVAARYNQPIVDALVEGALKALKQHGAKADPVLSVPGSYEVPSAAQALGDAGTTPAVDRPGCPLKGETDHTAPLADAHPRAHTAVPPARGRRVGPLAPAGPRGGMLGGGGPRARARVVFAPRGS
mgnify:CR=1 FL=1